LKASLACLFANVQGVMFMLTRFGTYNFSVRLRMPKAVRIEDAAKEVAYKKNYPQQFFVSETRIDKNQVMLTVHYDDGSFWRPEGAQWDICWDFAKTGQCKRMGSCKWLHIPPAYFTITIEHPPQ
jgi:hypothetical protein